MEQDRPLDPQIPSPPQPQVPNTSRPPADWQVPDPTEYPDPYSPGIADPRPETKVPGQSQGGGKDFHDGGI